MSKLDTICSNTYSIYLAGSSTCRLFKMLTIDKHKFKQKYNNFGYLSTKFWLKGNDIDYHRYWYKILENKKFPKIYFKKNKIRPLKTPRKRPSYTFWPQLLIMPNWDLNQGPLSPESTLTSVQKNML